MWDAGGRSSSDADGSATVQQVRTEVASTAVLPCCTRCTMHRKIAVFRCIYDDFAGRLGGDRCLQVAGELQFLPLTPSPACMLINTTR